MDWVIRKGARYPEILTPPEGAVGFIYMIHFTDYDKSYIGRKSFWSSRKRKFGKRESALVTDKRKKKYEIVIKESNWRTYNSSNLDVRSRIACGDKHVKIILDIAYSKKQLSYMEERALFSNKVLETDNFINDNIAGRYFTKDAIWEHIKS